MTTSFRWLWLGAATANLGDGVALTAMPLIALAAGAGAAQVAFVTTLTTIAWPLFGMHAGWIVDRVPPARLLLVVNLVRGTTFTLLAVALLLDVVVIPAVFATAVIYGVAETVVDTALTSAVPKVVPTRALTTANARLEATINVLNQFAGPPMAGVLVGLSTVLSAATGSLLYLLAALSAVGLHWYMSRPRAATGTTDATDATDEGDAATGGDSSTEDSGRLRDGMTFLWRHRLLRSLTLLTAGMNLVWSAWFGVFVVYAVSPGPLGLDPSGYGWLMTAMAAGGVLASLAARQLQQHFGTTTLLFADVVGTIALVLPAALDAPLWCVAGGIVLAGAGASIWRILVAVVRQQYTPAHLMGRVYAASRVISWGALPVGSALAGVLAEWFDLTTVFVAASVLATLMAVAFPLLHLSETMRTTPRFDERSDTEHPIEQRTHQ